jgi:transcription elongation factor SPT5
VLSWSAWKSDFSADPDIVGKTVRITKGQYKGELAQVVDATGTHFSVELLSKMRKVMVEKEKTVLVGDKGGSLDPEKRAQRHPGGMDPRMGPFGIPATPFLTAETPHGIGGETPRMLGNETPMLGGETPGSRGGGAGGARGGGGGGGGGRGRPRAPGHDGGGAGAGERRRRRKEEAGAI